MINFNEIKKSQRFSYEQYLGAIRHKLRFISLFYFGDVLTLRCKVTGKDDWYREVYLTKEDFDINGIPKARMK